MRQDGRAKIAKANDFENMRFDKLLAGILEQRASKESPKTAEKAPQDDSRERPKEGRFFT